MKFKFADRAMLRDRFDYIWSYGEVADVWTLRTNKPPELPGEAIPTSSRSWESLCRDFAPLTTVLGSPTYVFDTFGVRFLAPEQSAKTVPQFDNKDFFHHAVDSSGPQDVSANRSTPTELAVDNMRVTDAAGRPWKYRAFTDTWYAADLKPGTKQAGFSYHRLVGEYGPLRKSDKHNRAVALARQALEAIEVHFVNDPYDIQRKLRGIVNLLEDAQ